MKVLLTLENGEKVPAEWNIICNSTETPVHNNELQYNGNMIYTYQLPIHHKMFAFYRDGITASQYKEVVEELYKRNVSHISIEICQTLSVDNDSFESFNKHGYLHSTFINAGLVVAPRVVGYATLDGLVVNDATAINQVLENMYEYYLESQMFGVREVMVYYDEEVFIDFVKIEKVEE